MLNKIIDTESFNSVVKGRHGYVVFNKNDTFVGKALEKYGEFCEHEVHLFKQICRPADLVIEVGANIGSHTLAIAKTVGNQGRVFAFEPQRIVFQTLCANMAINSIENVDCYQMAASQEAGVLTVPDIRYDMEGNFGGVSLDGVKAGYKVQSVCLDDILNIPRLRLIKIDVEGMETSVINGAKRLITQLRPALYVENDRVEHSKALIELIQSLNYRLYWHTPLLYNPDNFANDKEDIYPGIASINMFCVPTEANVNMDGFEEIKSCDEHPLIGKS